MFWIDHGVIFSMLRWYDHTIRNKGNTERLRDVEAFLVRFAITYFSTIMKCVLFVSSSMGAWFQVLAHNVILTKRLMSISRPPPPSTNKKVVTFFHLDPALQTTV